MLEKATLTLRDKNLAISLATQPFIFFIAEPVEHHFLTCTHVRMYTDSIL